MRKIPKAVWKKEDRVNVRIPGLELVDVVISEDPYWNGYTYMYSFYGTDVRAGESYICSYVPPHAEQEMIDAIQEWLDQFDKVSEIRAEDIVEVIQVKWTFTKKDV